MRKLSLAVIGMYLGIVQAFSQTAGPDSSSFKPKKLKLDEVNLVSSYYNQTADKSAVMGGDPVPKGVANVTDFANGIDLTFIGWDAKLRKNTLALGLGVDYHTAASQAYVDSNGTSKNNGTRIYPTLNWTIENEQKGTTFGLGAYYSAEHQYYHSIGVNALIAKKNKSNGEFSLKLTGFFDKINMIYPSEFYPVDSVKMPRSPTVLSTAHQPADKLRLLFIKMDNWSGIQKHIRKKHQLNPGILIPHHFHSPRSLTSACRPV